MTTNDFTYASQCMTCNASDQIIKDVHQRFRGGDSFYQIANALEDNFGFSISHDAVANHLKKHYKGAEPGVILGVVTPPNGFQPGYELDESGEGVLTTPPQSSESEITDFSDIMREMGISPDEFTVVGSARVSKWQAQVRVRDEDGEYNTELKWMTSYKVNIQKKPSDSESIPFTELFKLAERRFEPTKNVAASFGHNTLIVAPSDAQAGKTGSRGDSEELYKRVLKKKEKLEDYMVKYSEDFSDAIFADAGDIVESFSNTGGQAFTNDLSLMDQLQLASTLTMELLSPVINHPSILSTTVSTVPSNHGAWRNGKDYLGLPKDDWGVYLFRQMENTLRYAGVTEDEVNFKFAEDYRKNLTIPTRHGINIGLTHGDDCSNPDKFPDWLAKQVNGGMPLHDADIVLSGHYHHLRIQPVGRKGDTQRQKWWIQLPTLDNGSDWATNSFLSGDSDAGLVVFQVNENGLLMDTLALL